MSALDSDQRTAGSLPIAPEAAAAPLQDAGADDLAGSSGGPPGGWSGAEGRVRRTGRRPSAIASGQGADVRRPRDRLGYKHDPLVPGFPRRKNLQGNNLLPAFLHGGLPSLI